MIRTLLSKELRQLRAFWLMFLAFELCAVAYELATARPDEFRWAMSSIYPSNGPADSAVTYFLYALVVGFSLFPREEEEGTLDFLASLPIRRVQIFATKILAGLLL